jgi:hypothetical protein
MPGPAAAGSSIQAPVAEWFRVRGTTLLLFFSRSILLGIFSKSFVLIRS